MEEIRMMVLTPEKGGPGIMVTWGVGVIEEDAGTMEVGSHVYEVTSLTPPNADDEGRYLPILIAVPRS